MRVRLRQLRPWADNPRKSFPKEAHQQLVASIKEFGVLQAPIAVETGEYINQHEPVYEVRIGGRRLRAMQEVYDPETEVEIELRDVVSIDEALAENTARTDMTPQEEYKAFARLALRAENPLSVKQIAKAYGIKPKRVEQRLALGNLAPTIMEAWEKGKLDDEAAMALANARDHETQLKVWKQAKSAWQIRSLLNSKRINAKFAIFDPKLYDGGVSADLFAECEDAKEETWFLDTTRFWQLQDDALIQKRDKLLKEWGAVEIVRCEGRIGYDTQSKISREYERVYPAAKSKKEKRGRTVVILVGADGEVQELRDLMSKAQKKAAAQAEREAAGARGEPTRPEPDAPAEIGIGKGQVFDLVNIANEATLTAMMDHGATPEMLVPLAATALLCRVSCNPDYGAMLHIPENSPARLAMDTIITALHAEYEWWPRRFDRFRQTYLSTEDATAIYRVFLMEPQHAAKLLAGLLGLMLHRGAGNQDALLPGALMHTLNADPLGEWKPTKEFLTKAPKPWLVKLAKDTLGTGKAAYLVAKKRTEIAAALAEALPADWRPEGFKPLTGEEIDAILDEKAKCDRELALIEPEDEGDAAFDDDPSMVEELEGDDSMEDAA